MFLEFFHFAQESKRSCGHIVLGLTAQAQRRRPRGAAIGTAARCRRSLQRMVRPHIHVQLESDRTTANCEAASFSVSFCAACRTSVGTQSGNGVTSNLCLPAGVWTSFKGASLCLENRPANET